jgi:hypothetical protein
VATRGREFPNRKRAGRNASEPLSSLVNYVEEPTLWSEGEGRWMGAGITEVAVIDSRGSRDGMYLKIDCPVRETRLRRWGDQRPLRIRKRKRSGCRRESEGSIVPIEIAGQHNPGRGKGPYFVRATEERRKRGLPCRQSPRTPSGGDRGSLTPRPSKNRPTAFTRSTTRLSPPDVN